MALLHDSVDSKKLDVRLVERNIARGVITLDEVQKALATLPDDSDHAEWVEIESLTEDLGDFEPNGAGYSQSH
jgi:hypothetical protein